ncbi:SGT1-like protein [Spatholobus suberectus]|nr:SGT1-like protein [Spatholobus suberectus]
MLLSIACIKHEKYQTAKAALEMGASLAPRDSRFPDLIKKCDKLIAGCWTDGLHQMESCLNPCKSSQQHGLEKQHVNVERMEDSADS